jgi:hypothetical protein
MKTRVSILLFAVVGLSACDKMDDPIIPNISGFRSDLYEIPTFTPNEDNSQHVLVEEFTGHQCGNCPGAAKWLKEFSETRPWVHIVGIHAGSLAVPTTTHPFDLTTPEGTAYFQQIGAVANPLARINRLPELSTFYVRAQWGSTITSMRENGNPPIKCQAKAEVYTAEHPLNLTSQNHLNIFGHFEGISVFEGQVRFSVFVLENNIIGNQLNYAPPNGDENYPANANIPDYPHKKVFRTVVNGLMGSNLTSELGPGYNDVKAFTVNVKDGWNYENLEVVIFASDAATGAVLNVCSAYAEVQ